MIPIFWASPIFNTLTKAGYILIGQVEGLTIVKLNWKKYQTNQAKYCDSCYFGRPYFGRLLDLCLSGSRLVGVVFVGVNQSVHLIIFLDAMRYLKSHYSDQLLILINFILRVSSPEKIKVTFY